MRKACAGIHRCPPGPCVLHGSLSMEVESLRSEDPQPSPDAPYSTTLETIDTCVDLASKHKRLLSMHVAESPGERELLSNATGPFAESLQSLGHWREGIFPWCRDPFTMLINRLSNAPRVLLIHGNDLREVEIRHLSNYSNITVVYCPRTHDFFDYVNHPVDRMLSMGIRVALGSKKCPCPPN